MAAVDGPTGTSCCDCASQTRAPERWSDMMDKDLETKQTSPSLGSLDTASSCGSPSSGGATSSVSPSSGSTTPRGLPIFGKGTPDGEAGGSWHAGRFCLNPNSPVFTPMGDLSCGSSMSNFAGQHLGHFDKYQTNLMWQLACHALRAEVALPIMEPAGRIRNSVKPQRTIGKSLEQVTLQLRGVPRDLTAESLILDTSNVCAGRYTFIYVPREFASGKASGRAFVCFVSQADTEVAKSYFEENGVVGEPVEVSLLPPDQHQQWLIARYRNSPVMHPDVPSEYKPVIFVNGQRVEFPAPTKAIMKIMSSSPTS